MLESMIVYDSRMFYEGGNPLLRPSVRQSIDLNLTYSWLTFVAGFTRENDLFTHIGRVYDEEKEIAIFQPVNFDHQDRVYATLVASPKLGFWQPNVTLHYYQQIFDAEKYGAPEKLNKPVQLRPEELVRYQSHDKGTGASQLYWQQPLGIHVSRQQLRSECPTTEVIL